MKQMPFDLLLGGLITAVGLMLLLLNLAGFGAAAPLIWALLFLASGLGLVIAVARDYAHWWALIPGTTLVSIGLLVGLAVIMPALAATWGGALVLGGVGAGFFAVYLRRPRDWWALIPAGALLTLAVITGLPEGASGPLAGAMLFGGLGLTFALVVVAPPGAPRLWALFPAGGLLALAALVLTNTYATLSLVGPALLILLGLALLFRAYRRSERWHEENAAAARPH